MHMPYIAYACEALPLSHLIPIGYLGILFVRYAEFQCV